MNSRGRCPKLVMVAMAAGLFSVGCAGEGGLRRFQPGRGSLPAGGTNPYIAMRPTYETPNGRRASRPVYLAGYGGYNYSRANNPAVVETSYDGRYYRHAFQKLFGGN